MLSNSTALKIVLATNAMYILAVDALMIRCKLGYEHSSNVDLTLDVIQVQNIILIAIYVRLALLSEDESAPLDHRHTAPLKFVPQLNESNPLYRFDTCGICLLDYVLDDQLRQLPCSHHFHMTCVDEWRRIQDKCPLCQHPIDEPFPRPAS